MWLTGFNAACLYTMYTGKSMHGGLIQAMARVNRVFRNRSGGLVVVSYPSAGSEQAGGGKTTLEIAPRAGG
jgi:type I restriction enzyme R subunit